MNNKSSNPLNLRIAVVGGMAAGKSTLLEHFQQSGYPVISMDKEILQLTQNPPHSYSDINNYFGFSVYTLQNGVFTFNLPAVLSHIHSSRKAYQHWQKFWAMLARNTYLEVYKHDTISVVEFPMLFEAELEADFNRIIFVDTPWRTRLERFKARGYTEHDFWKREKLHFSTEWKRAHADYIVQGERDTCNFAALLTEINNSVES